MPAGDSCCFLSSWFEFTLQILVIFMFSGKLPVCLEGDRQSAFNFFQGCFHA